MAHVNDNNLINEDQHGGRKGHSTSTCILEILEEVNSANRAKLCTALLAVDLSAAYDLCDHKILIQKCRIMNMGKPTIKWLTDFLNARVQYVELNGETSEILSMGEQGVIQGSPSSGNLFTLYINQLPAQVKPKLNTQQKKSKLDSCAKEYVDDLNTITKGKNMNMLKEKLVEDYYNLKVYLQNHRMIINPEKTKLMFTLPPKNKENLFITLDGIKINHQPDIKILGITLSEDLKFDKHIWSGPSNMVKQLGYKTSLLRSLKPFLPQKALHTIGNSIINSTILYGAPIWGITKAANIEMLQSCQIKAGRVIDGFGCKGNKSHRQTLLEKMKWPNVNQIIESAILNQTKRALSMEASKGLNNMFTKSFPRFQRGNKGWRIKNCGPAKETKVTFASKAQSLYNNLPSDLSNILLTPLEFKNKLRPYIKSTNHLKMH